MNRLFKKSLIMVAISTNLVVATDWLSFAGNTANSGASQDYAPRNLNSAVVTTSSNLGIKESSTPIVKDRKIYAYANGTTGSLYCLNAETLATEWQVPIMVNDFSGFGSWATPAVGSSSIVFAADAFLGCWNLDGTERWTIKLNNQVGNGSGKIVDNKVIVSCFHWANSEQSVSAFDLASGSNLWNLIDPAFAFSACTPVIDSETEKGYVAAGTKVVQFDLTNGSEDWNVTLPNATGLQNLSMNDNSLFVSDFAFSSSADGSNLYSVSKADGTINWIAQVKVSSVPPAIEGNILVHSAGDGWTVPHELTGLDINTGIQIWKVAKNLGGGTLMPAISKNVVYASANNSTNLTCINVTDGTVISEIVAGGCSPAIANDTLYTVFNGVVYAYSHKTEAMSVDKANVKIMLAKITKDGAKLSASIPMETSPTNWFHLSNYLKIELGDIVFLDWNPTIISYQYKEKISNKKVLWKFYDETSKTTIKWIAKKQVLQIKTNVKKFNLRNSISYKTEDGTETSNISSLFYAGYIYAKSVDSMTTETKKDKVKLKFKK